MRYVICGTKTAGGPTAYVSRHGCITHTAENAAVIRGKPAASLTAAGCELYYWRQHYPQYGWRIERLPRGPLASAMLRAVEVTEAELQAV